MFRAGDLLSALNQAISPPKGRVTNEAELVSKDGESMPIHEHISDSFSNGQSNEPDVHVSGSPVRQIPITDEASAMERLGHEPLLVEALDPNFKITRPGDLLIAAAIIESSAGIS